MYYHTKPFLFDLSSTLGISFNSMTPILYILKNRLLESIINRKLKGFIRLTDIFIYSPTFTSNACYHYTTTYILMIHSSIDKCTRINISLLYLQHIIYTISALS